MSGIVLIFDFLLRFLLKEYHFYYSEKSDKEEIIEKWHSESGVLIVGYDMLRNLLQKNETTKINEILVDPGPDIMILDEGHLLKNDKTSLSDVLASIRTQRKIVLTGTPLQNNLDEYFCMVNFVKPYLLGTQKEFKNRFENPITNGQYTNSNAQDIKIMKRRSHVLHNLLDGCVHRADMSILQPLLMPKEEYVIYVRLTNFQTKLYKV